MMRWLIGALFLLSSACLAQQGNMIALTGTGAPAGTCSYIMRYTKSDGTEYNCPLGTWNALAGSGTVTNIATISPITGGPITTTGTIGCSTCTVTIASGAKALATSAITHNTCTTAQTDTATGTVTTDTITFTPNADITGVTGYTPAGTLVIYAYPTAGVVNFKVCNKDQTNDVTPGAVTLNWRVTR